MTCRTVTAGQLDYRFCSDDPPPPGARSQAIVIGRAIDEMLGEPPEARMTVRHRHALMVGRTAAGGVFGIAGQPSKAMPDLALNPRTVDFSLEVDGYLRWNFAPTIPATPGFPDTFAPIDLGDVALHRRGIVIRGRTRQMTGAGIIPRSGATVRVAEIWAQAPGPAAPPGGDPPNLVALTAGLYADRDPAVDQLRPRDLLLVNLDAKTLRSPAIVGQSELLLSDRINLPASGIVAIDPTDPDRIEYLPFSAVTGATTADQPATLSLVHACRREHAPDVAVVPVQPQAPGADRAFTRFGIPGDVLAFIANLAGLALATTVELHGGAPAEFHALHHYEAISDADGFYRLPPLSRLAQVRLVATHPAILNPSEAVVSPDYRLSSTTVDLVFA